MADSKPATARKKPRQRRSAETFELILDTAATLLEEVGLDKLNTNLICKTAGLTPPALYRYFPNKYAIMEELGRRLMKAQNEDVYRWLDHDQADLREPETIKKILRGQYDITVAQKGGAWITRSLHASPKLADIRLKSHDQMVEKFVALQLQWTPEIDRMVVERKSRITVEAGYAVLEMLIDRAELDVDSFLDETSLMLASISNDLAE